MSYYHIMRDSAAEFSILEMCAHVAPVLKQLLLDSYRDTERKAKLDGLNTKKFAEMWKKKLASPTGWTVNLSKEVPDEILAKVEK